MMVLRRRVWLRTSSCGREVSSVWEMMGLIKLGILSLSVGDGSERDGKHVPGQASKTYLSLACILVSRGSANVNWDSRMRKPFRFSPLPV